MLSQLEEDKRLLSESGLFDIKWYLKKYPEVSFLEIDPLTHYLRYGFRLGYWPYGQFDPACYLSLHVDVRNAKLEPFTHYVRFGRAEGRSLSGDAIAIDSTRSISVQQPEVMRIGHNASTENKKRHVVLVSHDGNIGGAPNVVLTLAKWFTTRTDYVVSIISMGGGPIIEKFQAIAQTLVIGALRIEEDRLPQVRDLVREFLVDDPSFIILNSVASGGFLEINPVDCPIFAYIHEMPKILEFFLPQLEFIRKDVAHIFCNGVTVRDALELNYGFGSELLSVCPSFIDVGERNVADDVEKRAMKRRLGLEESLPLVVGCGVVHWRKQPALFVRLAEEILETGIKANFVWVGDGEDTPELQRRIEQLGLTERVNFVGHKDNFRDYLAASDVFALTSIEDPFPLVCLEAGLLGVPSVFFKEAGATWTFATPANKPAAGISVPIDRPELFIASIKELITDPAHAKALGKVAAQRVLDDHNLEIAAWSMFVKARKMAGVPPRVSVIVPNYNCFPFLSERLESIYRQSFKDYELILLDDVSTDSSLVHLRAWQPKFPDSQLHEGQTNSGSPFIAWQKGISLASGDLLWIAESDDYCEYHLLSSLVPKFVNPNLKLAYAKSIPVDNYGASQGDYSNLYLDRISEGRWSKSYTATANDEINIALGRANSIPNASAIICDRLAAYNAIQNTVGLRLAGDWAFYVSVIKGGEIAFCYDVTNYHRRHSGTITSSIEGSTRYFQELADVGALISALYGPNVERDTAARTFQDYERLRFGLHTDAPKGSLSKFGYLPDQAESSGLQLLPGLLYGVGDLSVGGAQTFAARFVSAWAQKGSRAVLAVNDINNVSDAVMSMISPDVVVVSFAEIERQGIENYMSSMDLSWILTGHWWAERAVGRLLEGTKDKSKWLTVMHGCHDTVIDNVESFPGWKEDLLRAETLCDGWIWTAPKNKRVFDRGFVHPKRLTHIVNGFAPVSLKPTRREDYNIPNDALVFTIASRAIEEKGWLLTYKVFNRLAKKWAPRVKSRLVMVGDGPAKEQIDALGVDPDRILMLGFIDNLAEVISISDVCLLPSWFSGESLPLTVIEFLAQGKPAIVSDTGLCGWAIQGEGTSDAGFVVSLDRESGQVDELKLEEAMEKFFYNRDLASQLEPAAKMAFQKFDFDLMMSKYVAFFQSLD